MFQSYDIRKDNHIRKTLQAACTGIFSAHLCIFWLSKQVVVFLLVLIVDTQFNIRTAEWVILSIFDF